MDTHYAVNRARLLAAALFVVALAGAAFGTEYYVNDSSTALDNWCTAVGDDANDGLAPATPKATTQSAIACGLLAGDNVFIDTGIYNLTSRIAVYPSQYTYGTAEHPISFIASPYGVTINCSYTAGIDWDIGTDYTVVTTASSTKYPDAPQSFMKITGAAIGMQIWGSHDVVSRCNVCDNSEFGVSFDDWNGGTSPRIQNCVVSNDDTGIQLCQDHAVIMNCTICWNSSSGIEVSWGPYCMFRNNVICADGSTPHSLGAGIFDVAASLPSWTCDYNDFYPTNGGSIGCYYIGQTLMICTTLTQWRTGTGLDAHSISADPLFGSQPGVDYHLKSPCGRYNPLSGLPPEDPAGWDLDDVKSPCIDAGDPTDTYSLEPMPNGGRINMGAYGNTEQASKSPLYISTTSLSGGQPGTAYSQVLTAAGGTGLFAWSIPSGGLPAGLSLDAATGAITGTPTTAGMALFTVQVADTQEPPATATKALSIAVATAGPTYQFAANDAEASTTSTNYIGRATLTFTPPSADDWIIFGFCEFKCPNAAYATFVQLFIDGVGEGQNTRKPVDPTDYLPFISVKVKNLSADPHTLKIMYRAGNSAAAAYIRRARICAVRKAALEFYNVAYDGAKALTINSTDVAVLTWTPATTGNYLVISTGEINASTTVSTDLQTIYNGVVNDEGIMRAADNGDYTTFMSFNYCANAPAGVPITHKISGRKMATDPINHYIRRARILALRLSNGRLNNTAAGSGIQQTTTQTAWQQCLTTTWTYGVNGKWLFLNSARLNNSSTSQQTEIRVQLNDNASYICGQQLMKPKDATDLLNYSSIDIRNLTTPRKVDMDYRTTNAAGTAMVKRLRFYGLPLDAQ